MKDPAQTFWFEYNFSRRIKAPSSPCLQACACCRIDSLYSTVKILRVRFSSFGSGMILVSTAVIGFGIALS